MEMLTGLFSLGVAWMRLSYSHPHYPVDTLDKLQEMMELQTESMIVVDAEILPG
jgi:hypothetical protein